MLGEEWGSEGKEGQIVLRWVRQVIGEGGDFGISEEKAGPCDRVGVVGATRVW